MAAFFRARSNINYVTTDLTMPTVSVRMDITDLWFKANTFDWILCSHVLEHIPDDRAAIRELRRVLKPGGVAVILVPLRTGLAKTWEDASITSPQERLLVFGQSDHVRNCGQDYRERIAAEGFRVTERNLYDEAPPEEARRFGLAKGDLIYVSTAIGT